MVWKCGLNSNKGTKQRNSLKGCDNGWFITRILGLFRTLVIVRGAFDISALLMFLMCLMSMYRRRVSQARNQNESGSKIAVLAACFMLVSCSTYSSTLKMEEIYWSETSVDFHQTTRRYIPENRDRQLLIILFLVSLLIWNVRSIFHKPHGFARLSLGEHPEESPCQWGSFYQDVRVKVIWNATTGECFLCQFCHRKQ
jgi:hypothetical protein